MRRFAAGADGGVAADAATAAAADGRARSPSWKTGEGPYAGEVADAIRLVRAAALLVTSPNGRRMMADQSWAMKGELVRSCNCSVFCPCVVSLGHQAPTEGNCLSWAGIRIDAGHAGDVDLGGLNVGLMLESPGPMNRGNWTVALYVDERASVYAGKALARIFSGKAGGTASLFATHVGRLLGIERARIVYETDGKARAFRVAKTIDGLVTPIPGMDPDRDTVISNSQYWIGPDITVARSDTSLLRAYGRNWDFAGRSAEICKLDWRGP
jgi:hypothetical protein